ncbi:unnamed protein product [Sphenostylis stenocarpa]|uniref:Uncharacterized protein n=1 Tax=Sphenostylis stenocarpa TaxID=92480 RepID=A0AA86RY66_9FABA|nr:unnamed protein product [Sphenostylis stenocarpa]
MGILPRPSDTTWMIPPNAPSRPALSFQWQMVKVEVTWMKHHHMLALTTLNLLCTQHQHKQIWDNTILFFDHISEVFVLEDEHELIDVDLGEFQAK